jgi:hypothetical protein
LNPYKYPSPLLLVEFKIPQSTCISPLVKVSV